MAIGLTGLKASGLTNYLGYLLLGKQLQSRCWIRFIDRVAGSCEGRIAGRIRVRTRRVDETAGDRGEEDTPTFDAHCDGACPGEDH